MYRVTDDEFERMIEDALASIPQRFRDELDNIAFVMEDEPDLEELGFVDENGEPFEPDPEYDDGTYTPDGDLLGLYDGISLLERADGYGVSMFDMPDTITLFKGPHERVCDTREQLAEEVRKTVVHEMGHYFGMDEDQVAEMGYE